MTRTWKTVMDSVSNVARKSNNGWVKSAAGGATIGVGIKTVVGGIGIAAGGTAVGIGAAPLVLLGSGIGLAGFGLYKLGQKSASQ